MKNTAFKTLLLLTLIGSFTSCSSKFDINKDGGDRIVVEISEKDVIKALSDNNQDSVFLLALEMAEQKRLESESDFVTLFGQSYKEIDPNASLVPIFLYEFRDKGLNVNSSNDEVLQILKDECKANDDRCCQIISNRLNQYCEKESTPYHEIKFNVTAKTEQGKIIIDLPRDERIDLSRVRDLIQSKGAFGFWETYNFSEISSCFDEVNAELAKNHKELTSDSLTDDESFNQYRENNPLFAYLQPSYYQNEAGQIMAGETARVGVAQVQDTATINHMLAETKDLFPHNLKFAWTAKPITIQGKAELLDLVALKISRDNKCALGSEAIADATQEYDQYNNPGVHIIMNPEGANAWKRLTGNNIGRQIAIVIDDHVFSYPVVNCEIANGRSTISGGGMTAEEAQNLANILKSGRIPTTVRIVEESQIDPK